MFLLWFLSFLAFVLLILLRLCWVLPFCNYRVNSVKTPCPNSSLMVFLGSGGHTGEMLRLLQNYNFDHIQTVNWIISSGDTNSLKKAQDFTNNTLLNSKYLEKFSLNIQEEYNPSLSLSKYLQRKEPNSFCINYVFLPRARLVGQSFKSSILTTLYTLLTTLILFLWFPIPDITLINGPGTAIPLSYTIWFYSFLTRFQRKSKIIYIESLARVSKLSLTGKLIYPITDRFLVQWPELNKKIKRSEYYGILV